MPRNRLSGFASPRLFFALTLGSLGVALAATSLVAPPPTSQPHIASPAQERARYMPVAGEKGEDLDRLEAQWHDRLTYPSGRFDPAWLRQAASQDKLIRSAVPLGF